MPALPTFDDLRARAEQAPTGVVAIYLFGSVARGSASAASDIDLGVLMADRPASTLDGRLLDFEAALERELGRSVQIAILNDAPPDLAHRVLRDGRILLERDRSARLGFEVRTRNLYFDLLPFLTRYRTRAIARASQTR